MLALTKFIEGENFWNKIQNKPEITIPTNKQECEPLFNTLECKLSPENLHCDGEISRADANRKYIEFMKVWNTLEEIQDEEREVHV